MSTPTSPDYDEIAAGYRFDYAKAKPNRFAEKMKSSPIVVILDEDVARIFKSTEQVNNALRALISAIPGASN